MKADCQNQETRSKTNLQHHLQTATLFFPLKLNITRIVCEGFGLHCVWETITVEIHCTYFAFSTLVLVFMFIHSLKILHIMDQ